MTGLDLSAEVQQASDICMPEMSLAGTRSYRQPVAIDSLLLEAALSRIEAASLSLTSFSTQAFVSGWYSSHKPGLLE